MGKVKEKITEVRTHNGWNEDRDVKEKYENFIQIIKAKLEETTTERKHKNNSGNEGKRKIENK
jgi:uncharacterized protein YktA (UPF0223 family)